MTTAFTLTEHLDDKSFGIEAFLLINIPNMLDCMCFDVKQHCLEQI